ncbi:DnaB-like helicase C-terminal domain-containing protein [Ktedonospora formicarum]|uniref:SF4 helicase domain-containing protein n=1 Tax=Ktedonospora formicarum TaxID=2778364 RepID=A0A8J3MQ64_9CHLR|nr:DnaB-like helicase C-terminal domain-containing protein [Ktedonospora formicarum]GHO44547.1 hypothetical protein KSX_27100 [Ktedonospora formicarum]
MGVSNSYEIAQELIREAEEGAKNPTPLTGIPWFPVEYNANGRVIKESMSQLDLLTMGIQNNPSGEMTVLAARPNVGKSAFAAFAGVNVARWFKVHRPGKVVRFVLLEMHEKTFQRRMVSWMSGVSMRRLKEHDYGPGELQKVIKANQELASLPIEYYSAAQNYNLIDTWVRFDSENKLKPGQRGYVDSNCGWWALDHIGIVPDDGDPKYRTNSLSTISTKIKKLCFEVAPGLILAQLNRNCELRNDKRPILADISSADRIGQDADNVYMLYREDMYVQVSEDMRDKPKVVELLIRKAREGELATITLAFDARYARYIDIPPEAADFEREAA